jgi:hypothetical protein
MEELDEYQFTDEEKELIADIDYDIRGAGILKLGKYNIASTGAVTGFSFGVSWGRYGYAGGVLSNEEARRLAEHILSALNSEQV